MSGGLNVIARTQKIIVEPASASVAVTNVGMPGPVGPRGLQGPPGPGGPGTTPEWAHVAVVSGSFGISATTVGLNKVAGSSGIVVANGAQLKVPKVGMYLVNISLTIHGTGGVGWVILGTDHKRANGTIASTTAVVGQIDAPSSFTVIPSTAIFNMLANDYIVVNVNSSVNGQTLDTRSALSITELPSNIGPAVVPPGGNTGQVLVKLSTNNYDVGWADPS
jgi:hypothetical protein